MIVTFCGHARFSKREEYEQKIFDYLEEKVGDRSADMYLGGYGEFDGFAYACCKKYKEKHPKTSLVFVTPYLTSAYSKERANYEQEKYDTILYPEIEDKPPRLAIIYLNQWMIEKADCVIAYVTHDWGGAYQAYTYAKKRGKEIFNLATFES